MLKREAGGTPIETFYGNVALDAGDNLDAMDLNVHGIGGADGIAYRPMP